LATVANVIILFCIILDTIVTLHLVLKEAMLIVPKSAYKHWL
jgi:hypothetical protein